MRKFNPCGNSMIEWQEFTLAAGPISTASCAGTSSSYYSPLEDYGGINCQSSPSQSGGLHLDSHYSYFSFAAGPYGFQLDLKFKSLLELDP